MGKGIQMYKYILKRLLFLIPTILGVTLIIYAVMNITPGDPAAAILGPGTPEADRIAYNEMLPSRYAAGVADR